MPNRDLVVIGASAGGLPALYAILGSLPPTLPAAVVVVVHTRSTAGVLPQVLGRRSALPVDAAADGAGLEPGRVYVAPADRHVLDRQEGTSGGSRSARERVPSRRRSPVPHRGAIARHRCRRRHPVGRARRRRQRVEHDRPSWRDRHRPVVHTRSTAGVPPQVLGGAARCRSTPPPTAPTSSQGGSTSRPPTGTCSSARGDSASFAGRARTGSALPSIPCSAPRPDRAGPASSASSSRARSTTAPAG